MVLARKPFTPGFWTMSDDDVLLFKMMYGAEGSFTLMDAKPATEATVAALANKLPASATTIPGDNDAGQPVRQVPSDLWRCSFVDVGSGIQTPDLTSLQVGSGQAINQSGGNLVITSGTTANAETLARSVRTFKGAHILRAKTILSQRIAQNWFEIALADLIGELLAYTINSATSVTVTFPAGTNPFTAKNVGQFVNLGVIAGAAGVPGRYAIASTSGDTVTFTVAGWPASGSGTLTIWGWNYHRIAYDGATATNAKYDAQRRGWNSGDSTLTINTTASPGHVAHLQSDGSKAAVADALVASNAGSQFTPRGSRIENLPNDDTVFYLWIVCRNGTSAPAGTTTWTVGFVSVELPGNNRVHIAGGTECGQPFGLAINPQGTQTVSVTGNPVLGAGTNAVGDVGVQYRANATGAATPARVNCPATPAPQAIKGAAGRLLGVCLTNLGAATRYLKVWNTASGSVTIGTTAALFEIALPPNVPVIFGFEGGVALGTAITMAITGGKGLTDNTVVLLDDVVGTAFYA